MADRQREPISKNDKGCAAGDRISGDLTHPNKTRSMDEKTHTPFLLEVAVADLDDAIAAQATGADRLELNSGMPLGGLTPSVGLVRDVLAAVTIPVIVMIRPRPGGFCYSATQWNTALRDVEAVLGAGVAGIAIGALDDARNVDQARMSEARSVAGPRELVFHRAFDLTADWRRAADALQRCGVNRILSSGQQTDVVAGLTTLKQLLEHVDGRIEVCAGSGVSSRNITRLYELGIRQFHGTFSRPASDPGYLDGPFRFAENDQLRTVDTEELTSARTTLLRLAGL